MADVPAIDVSELSNMLKSPNPPLVIDVREKWENELCCLPGSRLIPLGSLPAQYSDLPKDATIVVHCHHGGRSARAVAFLREHGFTNVFNLKGGIHDWSVRIDPDVKTYE